MGQWTDLYIFKCVNECNNWQSNINQQLSEFKCVIIGKASQNAIHQQWDRDRSWTICGSSSPWINQNSWLHKGCPFPWGRLRVNLDQDKSEWQGEGYVGRSRNRATPNHAKMIILNQESTCADCSNMSWGLLHCHGLGFDVALGAHSPKYAELAWYTPILFQKKPLYVAWLMFYSSLDHLRYVLGNC